MTSRGQCPRGGGACEWLHPPPLQEILYPPGVPPIQVQTPPPTWLAGYGPVGLYQIGHIPSRPLFRHARPRFPSFWQHWDLGLGSFESQSLPSLHWQAIRRVHHIKEPPQCVPKVHSASCQGELPVVSLASMTRGPGVGELGVKCCAYVVCCIKVARHIRVISNVQIFDNKQLESPPWKDSWTALGFFSGLRSETLC